jgi:hypothetical protein
MEEFNSPILEAAMALHEMFKTFMEAGFTESQALTLVSDVLKNSGKEGLQNEQ